jgi:hypothetical protein
LGGDQAGVRDGDQAAERIVLRSLIAAQAAISCRIGSAGDLARRGAGCAASGGGARGVRGGLGRPKLLFQPCVSFDLAILPFIALKRWVSLCISEIEAIPNDVRMGGSILQLSCDLVVLSRFAGDYLFVVPIECC